MNLSLVHQYLVFRRGLPHYAFRNDYFSHLRVFVSQASAMAQCGLVSPVPGSSGSPRNVRTCDAETGSPRKTQHVHLRMRPARSGRSRLCTVTGDSVSGCPGAGGSCSLRLPSTYSASVDSAAILPTSGCIVQSNYSPGGGGSGVQEFGSRAGSHPGVRCNLVG